MLTDDEIKQRIALLEQQRDQNSKRLAQIDGQIGQLSQQRDLIQAQLISNDGALAFARSLLAPQADEGQATQKAE